MALIKRGTKGSKLTHQELDGNFDFLNEKTLYEGELDIKILADPQNPPNGFDNILMVPISSLIGKGVDFKGTLVENEQLADSSAFGNPDGFPDDMLITTKVYMGAFNIAPLLGLSGGEEIWSSLDYTEFSITDVAGGTVILFEVHMEGSEAEDVYSFDLNRGSNERHRFRLSDIKWTEYLIPSDELIFVSDTGVANSQGSRYGGGGSSAVVNGTIGYYIESAITGPGEIAFKVSSNTTSDFNDISWEIGLDGATSSGNLTSLDPNNSVSSETVTLNLASNSISDDTWYVLKVIDDSEFGTIEQKILFKTEATSSGTYQNWVAPSSTLEGASTTDFAVAPITYKPKIPSPSNPYRLVVEQYDGNNNLILHAENVDDTLGDPISLGMIRPETSFIRNGFQESIRISFIEYIDTSSEYGTPPWMAGIHPTYEGFILFAQ